MILCGQPPDLVSYDPAASDCVNGEVVSLSTDIVPLATEDSKPNLLFCGFPPVQYDVKTNDCIDNVLVPVKKLVSNITETLSIPNQVENHLWVLVGILAALVVILSVVLVVVCLRKRNKTIEAVVTSSERTTMMSSVDIEMQPFEPV